MLLSKSCEYGIRASLYVSMHGGDEYLPIRVISADLDMSAHFLTKILQQLTRAGIMKSFKGPKGGVALARPASDIRLMDLVAAIDGPQLFQECMLGLPGCGERKPCPLHNRWMIERSRLAALFEATTLDELTKSGVGTSIRLAG
jgi:Rrf2 family protein